MEIEKKLKYGSFTWNDEKKEFRVYGANEDEATFVILNKVYAFAFLRFIIRIAQRNWFRKKK